MPVSRYIIVLLHFLAVCGVCWSQTGGCWDINGSCEGRAAEGYCEDEREYMMANCSLSCGFCTTGEGNQPATTTTARPTTTAVNRYPRWTRELLVLQTPGLREDRAIGYVIGTLEASDPDGDSLRYWTNRVDIFNVNSSSGRVTLRSRLDREVTAQFEAQFCVADIRDNTLCGSYDVNVIDVNDNVPTFSQSSYAFTVGEDFEPTSDNILYTNINVSDLDAGVNARVNVTCDDRTQAERVCDKFGIQQVHVSEGVYNISISLIEVLDYEYEKNYNFSLLASNDAANPVLSSSVDVSVTVADVQEVGPRLLNTPMFLIVNENTPSGVVVETLRAMDIDVSNGHPVRISIYQATHNYFTIGETAHMGEGVYAADIISTGALDREVTAGEYSFSVQAAEVVNGVPSTELRSLGSVSVTVLDVNDNSPIFSRSQYYVEVLEGLTTISFNPSLDIIDRDQGDNSQFQLSFVDPQYNNYLRIVPSTGRGSLTAVIQVTDQSKMNYESLVDRRQIIEIMARESLTTEGRSSTATVTIVLVDANDNAPVFSRPEYTSTVREDRIIGYSIATITATDADSGPYGDITYRIEGKDASKFLVNSTTGQIYLAAVLDFETQRQLEAVYVATDGGNVSSTLPFLITVTNSNDQGPVFVNEQYETTVRETTTVLRPEITVLAYDRESDNDVSYRIVSGNIGNAFQLGPVTGKLTMTKPVSYEQTNGQGYIRLIVEATDSDTPPLTSNVPIIVTIVDENTHDPVFSNTIYEGTVTETSPTGTSAVHVNANDDDQGDNGRITYQIHSGSKDNFVIQPSTGLITVAPNADLDIDTNGDKYDMIVYAVDTGSPRRTASTQAIVYVVDANNKLPSFRQDYFLFYVQDSVDLGHLVGTVIATDPDSSSDLMYTIVPNSFSAKDRYGTAIPDDENPGDYKNAFVVNSTSGDITTNRRLDRDLVGEVNFMVQVRDVFGEVPRPQTDSATVAVVLRSETEGTLRFQQPWTPGNPSISVSVNESEVPDRQLIVLVATGNEGQTIVTDYREVPGSDPNNNFRVERTSGAIYLNRRLDYESLPSKLLTFQVEAFTSEATPRSAMTTVNVEVINVNDNSPNFLQNSYRFEVSENVKYPYQIGSMIATDSDLGPYGVVRYNITGTGAEDFIVDPLRGNLSVAPGVQLSYKTKREYLLTVTATDNPDGGGVQRHTALPLTITILDENDKAPEFENNPYYFYVHYNLGPQSSLGRVRARDDDTGNNGVITYSLRPDDQSANFFIETTTGIIRNRVNLATLARDESYELTVQAWDGASPPRYTETTAYVFIGNYTDGGIRLIFPTDGYTVEVDENTPGNYSLINITAINPNTSSQTGLKFGFIPSSNQDERKFYIDPETGRITVNYDADLDRESKPNYEMTVSIETTDKPPQQMNFRLRVRLLDLNDTDPSFYCPQLRTERPTFASVAENEPIKTSVTKVKACDGDEVSVIYYHIIGGNDYLESSNGSRINSFKIDSKLGVIYTNLVLDREVKSRYDLTILASSEPTFDRDSGMRRRRAAYSDSALLDVIITVTDVDDSSPKFNGTGGNTITTGVLTTAAFGSPVIRVNAIDDDSSSVLRYSLGSIVFVDSANERNSISTPPFVIDGGTGVVSTSQDSFIYNTEGYYTMEVSASDGSREALANLFIVVVRENALIRYVINEKPQDFRDNDESFIRKVNEQLPDIEKITANSLHYHIEEDGDADFEKSDLCFYLIEGRKSVDVETAIVKMKNYEEKNPSLGDLYNLTKVEDIGWCEVKTTTQWWSGYWWLWWLLIALALLIFILALFLVIFIWWRWDILTTHLRHMMYEATPAQVTGTVARLPEHEWQEQVVHMD